MINAALKPDPDILAKISAAPQNSAIFSQDNLVAAKLSAEVTAKSAIVDLPQRPVTFSQEVKAIEIRAELFGHLWDMVNFNGKAIIMDAFNFKPGKKAETKPFRVPEQDIYVHLSASVPASVYIDVSRGPVVIDAEAIIEPRSLIQGPAYIGQGSQLMGGIIREACSLGPVCKVGGELEESIILGYSNKCHEGFIGHSYIGEWVNLGALTTNSDLKNNYSEITVRLGGVDIPTGSIKAGSYIGDHTKTGIGTLLNTGIVIGFCCNLYGGGLFAAKEIGHFRWGTPDDLVEFRLDKAIEIAKTVMARRDMEFSDATRALFADIRSLMQKKASAKVRRR